MLQDLHKKVPAVVGKDTSSDIVRPNPIACETGVRQERHTCGDRRKATVSPLAALPDAGLWDPPCQSSESFKTLSCPSVRSHPLSTAISGLRHANHYYHPVRP